IKAEDCLKAQQEQKEKIATYKRDTEQTDLIEKVKKNVVAEFRELHLWLEGQEKLLLTKMEETEKDIMARKEKDTADPERLKISEDRKSITGLKGFFYNPCVFGCQMFSSGRHFWDVIVGGTGGWSVGVTSKPVNFTHVHAQTRWWQISGWEGISTATSLSGYSELVLTERPMKIRISLNCEGGQVSFFDAKTASPLHAVSDASLVGETLLPCFYLCE
ncbi:Tripartite motif-containing protein 39, partial [Ophiophagus hannah]